MPERIKEFIFSVLVAPCWKMKIMVWAQPIVSVRRKSWKSWKSWSSRADRNFCQANLALSQGRRYKPGWRHRCHYIPSLYKMLSFSNKTMKPSATMWIILGTRADTWFTMRIKAYKVNNFCIWWLLLLCFNLE